ncbi:signal peptide peptidase SppA [Myxococcota bacterium]|nr:signal peptide peptidase SppA [Myxococcota bacterium]
MRGAFRSLTAIVVAAVAAAPGPLAAQRPTAGVLLPQSDVAGGQHVEQAADNPAVLGFGGDFEFTWHYLGTPNESSGTGQAVHAGVGFLAPYHTGLSLQFLDVPGKQAHEPVKFTWAHALSPTPALSIGFSWSTFTADEDRSLGGLSAWDAGIVWRPWRYLALGAAVTDFNTPIYRGTSLPRGWNLGLALRPGTERLTLSGAARLEEDGGDEPTYGGRLDWNFWGPLSILGRYDTRTTDAGRSHAILGGLAYQIASRVGIGVHGFVPDTAAETTNAGLGTYVRVGTDAEPHRRPRLWHTVVELGFAEGLDEFQVPGFFETRPETPFLDALQRLRALSRDARVDALLLTLTDLDVGWAQAEELRGAVAEARARGKSVFAYLPVADTRAYYIATACDRIFTTPAGGVMLTGIRGDFLYIRGLLDKLGIAAQFVALGDYKSAPEMFTREAPSPAAAEAEHALLDPLYERLVRAIATARRKTDDQVRALIDAGPYTAAAAQSAGLVDGVLHYDEFEQVFTQVYGPRVRFVTPEVLLDRRDPRWGEPPRIGLLYAVGTITDGESIANPFTGSVSTGADTFIEAVRTLRDDGGIRAVVLRIDSPGGSVTASDVMWRELRLLAKEKPLLVSMGDTAASGGYYLAVAGNEILADPSTVTGSIGIFTGKFDLSGLYGLLGVRFETFRRGARADFLGTTRPWTEDELLSVRQAMEALYGVFKQRVGEGRSALSAEQIEAVARGRVWLGSQARERGLVDAEGGLLATIDRAASRLGLDEGDYALEVWPKGGGLGGLPRSPVLAPAAHLATLIGGGSPSLTDRLPAALRMLLELPLLHFRSGDALALLPFVLAPER